MNSYYPNPDRHCQLQCVRILNSSLEFLCVLILAMFQKVKPAVLIVAARTIATASALQLIQVFLIDHKRNFTQQSLLPTMEMSHHLLCEPYLDAALHGVLLHPPSQIPDHMPYTYSFRVLLLPSTSTYIVSNIHIIYNNFLWLIEKLGALTRKNLSTLTQSQVQIESISSRKVQLLLHSFNLRENSFSHNLS